MFNLQGAPLCSCGNAVGFLPQTQSVGVHVTWSCSLIGCRRLENEAPMSHPHLFTRCLDLVVPRRRRLGIFLPRRPKLSFFQYRSSFLFDFHRSCSRPLEAPPTNAPSVYVCCSIESGKAL